MNLTWHELQQLPPVFIYEPEFVEVEEKAATENDWTIERDGDAYVVTGAWVDKIMARSISMTTNPASIWIVCSSLQAFTPSWRKWASEEGAPVVIGEFEFE